MVWTGGKEMGIRPWEQLVNRTRRLSVAASLARGTVLRARGVLEENDSGQFYLDTPPI